MEFGTYTSKCFFENVGKAPFHDRKALIAWIAKTRSFINKPNFNLCPITMRDILSVMAEEVQLAEAFNQAVGLQVPPSNQQLEAGLNIFGRYAGIGKFSAEAQRALSTIQQQAHEDVWSYTNRFQELQLSAGDFYNEGQLMKFYERGILDGLVAAEMAVRPFGSLAAMIDFATRVAEARSVRAGGVSHEPMIIDNIARTTIPPPPGLFSQPMTPALDVNLSAASPAAWAPQQTAPAQSSTSALGRDDLINAVTAAVVAAMSERRYKNNKNNNNYHARSNNNQRQAPVKRPRCYICDSEDHLFRDCPDRRRKD